MEKTNEAKKRSFETFGLLAGGLAHDYNNMLTAMLGGIDLILCDDIPDSAREAAEDVKIGTQPDMWEFGTSRAAAWDCPATVAFSLADMERHPRRDDLLEVMRRWEDVRARRWLTPEMKERLKSATQEHHLYLNDRGEYELHDIEMLPTPPQAPAARGFIFERGGRRVIACWHISGSGDFAIDLGTPETLPLSGVRYLETDLPREAAVAAWSRSRLESGQ